jgi:hypothetical protein
MKVPEYDGTVLNGETTGITAAGVMVAMWLSPVLG